MKLKNTILLAVALLTAINAQAQTPDMFIPYQQSDLRLPSYPLLLNDPYFSLWSPHDKLYDGTTRHWTDTEKPMNGLLRVDGTAYRFMGSKANSLLTSVAGCGMTGEVAWEAKVSYEKQSGTDWTRDTFDDSTWETQKAAWGTPGEYPNVSNPWTAGNSDIYEASPSHARTSPRNSGFSSPTTTSSNYTSTGASSSAQARHGCRARRVSSPTMRNDTSASARTSLPPTATTPPAAHTSTSGSSRTPT